MSLFMKNANKCLNVCLMKDKVDGKDQKKEEKVARQRVRGKMSADHLQTDRNLTFRL